MLSRSHPFDGRLLTAAIKATFARRGTEIPAGIPSGLGNEFATDIVHRRQWEAFRLPSWSRRPRSSLSRANRVGSRLARPARLERPSNAAALSGSRCHGRGISGASRPSRPLTWSDQGSRRPDAASPARRASAEPWSHGVSVGPWPRGPWSRRRSGPYREEGSDRGRSR
ncbi:MAG: hypothetical protein WCH32_12265 [Pseudomonadota bacterium]